MNCLKLILHCALYLSTILGFSRNTQQSIDSLKSELKALGETAEKAKGYNSIAWQYLNINLDLTKVYIDSSTVLYQKIRDKDGVQGNNYIYGVWHRKSGNYDSALVYLSNHKTYAERIKDTFNIANASYQKGVALASLGNYEKALKAYFEALKYYEFLRNKKSIGFVLNSIGIIQKNLEQYNESITSYQKSIAIHKELNDFNNLSNAYANLGNVYALQEKFDDAYESYEKSLELDTQMRNNWGIAINYMDMATVLTQKNKCNEALDLLQKALRIQQQNNFKKEEIETLLKIGKTYICLGNNKLAEDYFLKSLSKKPTAKSINQDIYYNLSEVALKNRNYKKALEHYKAYTTFKDSIYNEENLKNINDLQIRYETANKDREIEAQNAQIQLKETALLRKQNELRIAQFLVALGILFCLGIWIFFHQKRKIRTKELEALKANQEVEKLEALIAGEEKERMRLAQDLHDGINGDLSAIKYKVSTLNGKSTNQQDSSNKQTAIKMLDSAIEQIRYISHNLVPPSLQNFSLMESFAQLCSKIEASSPLKVDFQQFGNYKRMDKESEMALYRIVQELLHNSVKHAEAERVLVQINHHSDSMHLTVEDDGKGFDAISNPKGLGHKNIASRVSFLNAELDIDTTNHGTTVNILIPRKVLVDD